MEKFYSVFMVFFDTYRWPFPARYCCLGQLSVSSTTFPAFSTNSSHRWKQHEIQDRREVGVNLFLTNFHNSDRNGENSNAIMTFCGAYTIFYCLITRPSAIPTKSSGTWNERSSSRSLRVWFCTSKWKRTRFVTVVICIFEKKTTCVGYL